MPRPRPLVHSRLLPNLRRSFFARTVTIQAFDSSVVTASGHPTGAANNLVGHIDIPAAIDPINTRGLAERRPVSVESITVAEQTHEILLMGYFPAITAQHRAVDDGGDVYDIQKVDTDGARTLTRLQTRRVSPVAVEGR